MHLVKKYTGTAMDRLLLDLMVQGVFEGANTPDFRDAVVLHRITKVPLPDSNWVRVNCPSEFRYLRYRGPKGSNSCIAEAMFFDADGKLIRRTVEPIAAGGIAIVPDFPEEPVMVSCDDTRLRRAVTNILSNGVRYARSELRLTCRADKRHVTIRIQDDGDGIAEADLPHIFDRFYMGKSGKSGIGLALTKEIVHLHKGTIRAYNGDSGAVFEISIPVSR